MRQLSANSVRESLKPHNKSSISNNAKIGLRYVPFVKTSFLKDCLTIIWKVVGHGQNNVSYAKNWSLLKITKAI